MSCIEMFSVAMTSCMQWVLLFFKFTVTATSPHTYLSMPKGFKRNCACCCLCETLHKHCIWYFCYFVIQLFILCRPPLWSSGQSFWLKIQRSEFDSRRYQIFWEVVGLERGPLSLVNTTEELLGRKSSGFDLESREYGRRKPTRWPPSIHNSWH
jgi:hypothetical protein